MNDDYLWDKSGEPDPQIQQLEEILGTLRHQPQPLNLPRRRNYLALLAIAATVVMALLAGGLWTQIKSPNPSIPVIAIATPKNPEINPLISVSTSTPKKRKPRLARQDRREALAAKQQLMFALRLASEKLNAASRRTQHKAG
jgi:negative regulator of sigma E activity